MTKFRPDELPDLLVIDPDVHHDARGFLLETWQRERYRDIGVPELLLDVHSHSTAGVLRGLHFQHPHAQGKIVRVTQGRVLDVAVDVRRGAPTFARWWSCELSGDNRRQLWIPPGFAHGFLVLSPEADVEYRCSEYYRAEASRYLRWDDPRIGVPWPTRSPVLSPADAQARTLAELAADGALPEYRG